MKRSTMNMKKLTALLPLSLLFAVAVSAVAVAQEPPMPPKILTVTREYTKPGKSGSTHERAESLFVQAMAKANWPTHYLAAESLSGKSRALFFTPYDSFDAWEKDFAAVQKNTALAAAIDHAYAVDGELLSETENFVLAFREEYSLRPAVDIAHMRYFEISHFQVKPGHDKEWEEIVKLVMAAYEKIPGVHWATYASVYGFPDTSYIIFNAMKSASEIDKSFAQGKEFEAAMGEDGMRRLGELSAAAIESSQTNLFAFNPRMSYPLPEWVKADPDFWKTKGSAAPMTPKKKEAKAAASQ
jgi:hypothetical protein